MGVVSNRIVFWDGDNFVVVSKNCSQEQALKIMQALASADLGVEIVADAPVSPVKEPEEVMPVDPEQRDKPPVFDSPKRYAGKTPVDVLGAEKDKGFANLLFLRRKVHPQLRSAIEEALQEYFQRRFQGCTDAFEYAGKLTEKQCDTFFKYFGGVASEADQNVVREGHGSLNYEQAWKESNIEQKRALVAALIDKYAAKKEKIF